MQAIRTTWIMATLTLLPSLSADLWAAPKTINGRAIAYTQDTTHLEGLFFASSGKSTKVPAIVLFPDWMGVTETSKMQAKRFSDLGYAVFVADIYGKNVRPQSMQEAGQQSSFYKSNRPLMRLRAEAALATLKKQSGIDTTHLAAMGYCFGGTCALELARSGAPLLGVVSVHGGLDTPTPADSTTLKAKVLVLHGADDPYVPAEQVQNFIQEMKAAKADWQLNYYGNAVHAFSIPTAGNDPKKGAAYNPTADKRSLKAITAFYQEIFSNPSP